MIYPDDPGAIPLILASLRERATRTTPAPVDPADPPTADPDDDPDPAPAPAPDPSPTVQRLAARPAPAPGAPPLPTIASSASIQQAIGQPLAFVEATIPGNVGYRLAVAHRIGEPTSGFELVPLNQTNATLTFNGTQVGTNVSYAGVAVDDTLRLLVGTDAIVLYLNGKPFRTYDATEGTKVQVGARSLYAVMQEVIADTARIYGTARVVGSTTPLTQIKMGAYAKVYPPVSITAASVGVDGRIAVTLDYYCTSAELLLLTAKVGSTTILASVGMAIGENGTPGRASVSSLVPIPAIRRGAPIAVRVALAGTGEYADTSVIWAAPMSFGINPTPTLYYYCNAPTANKLDPTWKSRIFAPVELELRGPLTSDPQVDYRGNIIESAETRAMQPALLVAPPRIAGQRMRYRWTGKAKDVRFAGNGASSAGNVVAGSGGGYSWVDFNYNYVAGGLYTGKAADQLMWIAYTPDGTGTDWAKNFELLEIDATGNRVSPDFWDVAFVEEYRHFRGGFNPYRMMDMQNTVGISHLALDRPSEAGDRRGPQSFSVPDLLDLMTLVDGAPKLHVPMRATERMIRADARRSARWAKATGKVVSWRLSNEVWNNGQNAWRIAYEDGKAVLRLTEGPGGQNPSNHDIVMRYWSYRHKQVMVWITEEFEAEGVAHLLDRTVELQNGNPGNNVPVYDGEPGCADYIDGHETAPYVGGSHAISPTSIQTSTGYDIAEFVRRVRVSYPIVHAQAAEHRDFAHSRGKAFRTYEGGYEDTGLPGFWPIFSKSQEAYDLTRDLLDHWEANVGGQYTWYNDFRVDKHGYAQHIGQTVTPLPAGVAPAMIRTALFEKMREVTAKAA